MRKIFIVNGFPGSGKTTFGELVAETMNDRGISFKHISSIDPIKNILLNDTEHNASIVSSEYYQKLLELKKALTNGLDWDGATKDEYWRKVMSDFKGMVIDQIPGFIEGYIVAEAMKLPTNSCIFVDIREPEGIRALADYLSQGTQEVRMQSVFIESDSALYFNNSSDTGVSDYDYDILIRNNRNGIRPEDSLTQLRLEAVAFCNKQFPTQNGIGWLVQLKAFARRCKILDRGGG